jgi:hypothetical protein
VLNKLCVACPYCEAEDCAQPTLQALLWSVIIIPVLRIFQFALLPKEAGYRKEKIDANNNIPIEKRELTSNDISNKFEI